MNKPPQAQHGEDHGGRDANSETMARSRSRLSLEDAPAISSRAAAGKEKKIFGLSVTDLMTVNVISAPSAICTSGSGSRVRRASEPLMTTARSKMRTTAIVSMVSFVRKRAWKPATVNLIINGWIRSADLVGIDRQEAVGGARHFDDRAARHHGRCPARDVPEIVLRREDHGFLRQCGKAAEEVMIKYRDITPTASVRQGTQGFRQRRMPPRHAGARSIAPWCPKHMPEQIVSVTLEASGFGVGKRPMLRSFSARTGASYDGQWLTSTSRRTFCGHALPIAEATMVPGVFAHDVVRPVRAPRRAPPCQ